MKTPIKKKKNWQNVMKRIKNRKENEIEGKLENV